MTRIWLSLLTLALLAATGLAQQKPGVFDQPALNARLQQMTLRLQQLFASKDWVNAERLSRQTIALLPHHPSGHYNLACALAQQGKKKEALDALEEAVTRGFADVPHLAVDADLDSLRREPRFRALVQKALTPQPLLTFPSKVEPGEVDRGEAVVAEKNTAWDIRNQVFRVFFKVPAVDPKAEICKGEDEVAKLLRQWQKEGTAAGNHGDFYDNRDSDHSNMNYQRFPQLSRIEYSKEAQDRRLHHGLQTLFFFEGVVVLGNSSTAVVGGPFWRSQPRLAYSNPRSAEILWNQYANNHLYFYPEHRDHDPGHNGKKNGYGDVYPANTPYVIISQGSSGSDQAFMNAVAATLAAFRPDVKKRLVRERALMPVVQMILRQSNKMVKKDEDYLTGVAHPTVFDGAQLDVVKMVQLAHAITLEDLPPLAGLRVVQEDGAIPGVDFFEVTPLGERLFDTPAAIARVHRTVKRDRKMIVSAELSRDLDRKKLTYRWVVLRGDEKAIKIKPIKEDGSVVELTIGWHPRRPVLPGSELESNRVDLGLFVSNGKRWSAPAFISVHFLDNEKRTYDKEGRIQSVEYASTDQGGNYVDPALASLRNWKDEYRYTDSGKLLGWTRRRGKETQDFSPGGFLIEKKDDKGRAVEARTVIYSLTRNRDNVPVLEQKRGDERVTFEYASDDDVVGKITSRKKVQEQ